MPPLPHNGYNKFQLHKLSSYYLTCSYWYVNAMFYVYIKYLLTMKVFGALIVLIIWESNIITSHKLSYIQFSTQTWMSHRPVYVTIFRRCRLRFSICMKSVAKVCVINRRKLPWLIASMSPLDDSIGRIGGLQSAYITLPKDTQLIFCFFVKKLLLFLTDLWKQAQAWNQFIRYIFEDPTCLQSWR